MPDSIAAIPQFCLIRHLHRQRTFSQNTFGPGERTIGVLDHIRKELAEIEKDPSDLMEWIDVVLLALDGAWRSGHEPEEIAAALDAKQARNEARKWPDWRTADPNKAIEHNREADPLNPELGPEHREFWIRRVNARAEEVRDSEDLDDGC